MMKTLFRKIPRGIPCLVVVGLMFGYMGSVMGFTNMLNTIMHTAHDLLLNTVFYLMGMCVITGALGKVFVEFGVVDLLQKLLRPVMKPLFNMPGVASLAAVLTFMSDNPAIIAIGKNREISKYFKKYQHVSLVNFGTAFGMGMLVIVFMVGQGFFLSPVVGFMGAVCGGVIATRMMQYFTCKEFPSYRNEPAVVENADDEALQSSVSDNRDDSLFVRGLNALLDGGKDGVTIGLAIIPGVVIISTFVMMMTFGGTVEGYDEQGRELIVYTGGAYQGTQLLPWLAGKLSFIFEFLFGFHSPELVAFPITAFGAVGAALGLIPEFASKGILDNNAIAVFTAMGMCWSGFFSTHTAMLDTLGYRKLITKDFISQISGGIGAGISAHIIYISIMWVASLFAPQPVWEVHTKGILCNAEGTKDFTLTMLDDSTFVVKDWFGVEGTDLRFTVNSGDSTINVCNAYAEKDNSFFFVTINPEAQHGEIAYASLCPVQQYSEFDGDAYQGHFYVFAFLYDKNRQPIDRGYYELTWGGREWQTPEAEKGIRAEIAAERESAARDSVSADSIP